MECLFNTTTKEKIKIVVLYNPARPLDSNQKLQLKNILKDYNTSYLPTIKNQKLDTIKLLPECDLVITLGGDGTVIQAFQRLSDPDTPVVGINSGTLGFLTSVNPSNLEVLKDLLNNSVLIHKRYTLTINVKNITNNSIKTFYALNELHIDKSNRSMIHLNAFAGDVFLSEFEADGVIVATPTGSTAYNLSAGGPIISPESNVRVLTSICPHTITNRPLVFDSSQDLNFRISREDEISNLYLDNILACTIDKNHIVNVKQKGKTLNLVFPSDYNYYETLRNYLGWNKNNIVKLYD